MEPELEGHFERLRYIISALETLHRKYAPMVDWEHQRDGPTAAFLLFTRVIQASKTSLHLLEVDMLSEVEATIRVVRESISLAEYFCDGQNHKEYHRQLKRWFEGKTVTERVYREYLSTSPLGLIFPSAAEGATQMYSTLSAYSHPTFRSVLASYDQTEGFRYGQGSLRGRKIGSTILFQLVMALGVMAFLSGLRGVLGLTSEEVQQLDRYNAELPDHLQLPPQLRPTQLRG